MGLMNWSFYMGSRGNPIFITPQIIADFSAEDILKSLLKCGLINNFGEIRKNELFLILINPE